jgi:transposase-like protein
MKNPFRYFNSSPEVIRLTVMMYIRYPLSLRQVEDLLFERGIDVCHEKVRFWWNRFGHKTLPYIVIRFAPGSPLHRNPPITQNSKNPLTH